VSRDLGKEKKNFKQIEQKLIEEDEENQNENYAE